MSRLNTNLASLSVKLPKPTTAQNPVATLRQPASASRPEPRASLSDRSQFQSAQAPRRPVALTVPQDQSVQVGDRLRTTTTAERLEQASQDPLFRLRLAILEQRLDLDNRPQGPITDQRPGPISTEPPVGIVPEGSPLEASNELRTTTTAERLEQASQDPLFRLRLAIIAQRLGFNH